MKNTESTYLLYYTKIWRNNDKHTISWNTVWHCSWKSCIARATRRSVSHLLADNSLRTLLIGHTSGFHPHTFKLEPCMHLYNITGSHSFTRDSFNRMFHHKFWKIYQLLIIVSSGSVLVNLQTGCLKKLFRKWHHNVIIPEKKKKIQFNLYILNTEVGTCCVQTPDLQV